MQSSPTLLRQQSKLTSRETLGRDRSSDFRGQYRTHWLPRTSSAACCSKIGGHARRTTALRCSRSISAPAPEKLTQEAPERMLPVRFGSEKDALHGAALVLRGGQYPWLIDGPSVRLDAKESRNGALRC
jgi:hypothetical protein